MLESIKKKISDSSINRTIVFFVLFFIVATLFFSRQIFHFRYEPEYYENYYYSSQWNVPNSTRQISDGDLYKFVGYKLFYGENPFDINFPVPPFVKYLFGALEATTGNPYWVGVFFYLGSIAAMYLLAEELFKKRTVSLLSVLLLITTPFIAFQIRATMLDLPLMFLFLAHSLFFVKYLKKRKFSMLFWSGVFLGLATGTKIGVYTPLAVLLGVGIIFVTRKYKEALLYPFMVFGGYVASYFPTYFIRHPNPIPWLRLHEKSFNYYLGGGLGNVDHLNQWRGIFTNKYQGWWNPGVITPLENWSPLLPIGVMTATYVLYKAVKEKDFVWTYLSLFLGVILLAHTLIPFFPRYLVVAIPFIVFVALRAFEKNMIIIVMLVILNLPFLRSSLDTSDPSRNIKITANNLSTRAYRDLYRSLTPQDRKSISEEEFVGSFESFLEGLKTRKVKVEVGDVEVKGANARAKFSIAYDTQYGSAVHEPTIVYKKVNNEWKVDWEWDYLWNGYEPESEIELAGIVNGPKVVYMIPRLMYDWTDSLRQLSGITGLDLSLIDRRIRSVVPDDYPRFVGYLGEGVSVDEALVVKGVVLVEDDSSLWTKAYLRDTEGKVTEIVLDHGK